MIFQIMYIILGASLKRFVFYKVPPSGDSALWVAEHRKHSSEM